MLTQKARRNAFTLLELLVVVAIIGVLASLTAGAIFRLRASSLETRTNETLTKLHAAYEQQFKATMDKVRQEAIPFETMAWAQGNQDLARIIHIKMRLRQEFPQTSDDLKVYGGSITGTAAVDAQLKVIYGPKKIYTVNAALVGANYQDNNANAALLYIALSQARGAQAFNPDQISSGALGKTNVGGVEFKVFVDSFGNPILYARQIPGDGNSLPVLLELNDTPYVKANTPNGKKDPLDPNGVLANWTARNTIDNWIAGNESTLKNDGFNRGPLVFSSGADGVFGTADDLYSFRLKGTGKAN